MRALGICAIALALMTGATEASDNTHSDFNREYDLTALKTWDFKEQVRMWRERNAHDPLWSDDIRAAIATSIGAHGMVQDGRAEPDFLVAYYVGQRERYDIRSISYGLPVYGRGFRSWRGWPAGYDAWAVPYTKSTVIIDIIDARTNQLVWRGYNHDPISPGKADKDFNHAVEDVLERFYRDARKSTSKKS